MKKLFLGSTAFLAVMGVVVLAHGPALAMDDLDREKAQLRKENADLREVLRMREENAGLLRRLGQKRVEAPAPLSLAQGPHVQAASPAPSGETLRTEPAPRRVSPSVFESYAADMPPAFSKAPIAEPGWSWSGFYIGLQGGGGWGTVEDTAKTLQTCPAGGPCSLVLAFTVPASQRSINALSGFHGGGTAGYNFQYGQLVLGVEGDFSGADIEGRGDCSNSLGFVNAFGEAAGCHAKMTWFGTATARLGVTVDRALIFVKGGGAWAHFDESATANNPVGIGGPFAPGAPNSLTSTHSGTRSGFTVGTGIEYALGSNLSAKVEYDYMDFDTNTVTYVFGGPAAAGGILNLGVDEHQRIHLVKAGLNYRFNWH